jgi:phosphohistidine phosphatase
MRRHLLLVRHAKSSWDDLTMADRERPLSPRGMAALARMRDHLASGIGGDIDLVLCSPALRTRQTFDGIRSALPDQVQVTTVTDLYGADVDRLLQLLRSSGDDHRCTMLVGHNPGLADLAVLLVGAGDADERRQLRSKFPTGAIATLSFAGAWTELAAGSAHLDALFMPRPPRS